MLPAEKIRSLGDVVPLLAGARAAGQTLALTSGEFPLLHVATIRHLERVRSEADLLVVILTPDPAPGRSGSRPLFKQSYRSEAIAALQCVDYVVISGSPTEAIQALRPNVYGPCEMPSPSEAALVETLGGRVLPPLRNGRLPSLIPLHSPGIPPAADEFLSSFVSRYNFEGISAWLEKARELRVLFVGETIIDEYQFCETMGKSGKEPILAARYVSSEKFAGGVLSTANQAAAVCDHIGVVSLLGTQDSHEEFVRERLDPRIDATFLYVPGSPTILKRRMVEVYPFQKLFEVYFMDSVIPDAVSDALLARLKSVLPRYDAVVVTDYGHGMMTPAVVDLLCHSGKFLAINTQTNAANQGFNTVSKYPRADYVCVSEKELRLEARNRSKDVRLLMAATAEKLGASRVLVTRGSEGCLGYHVGEGFFAVPPFTNRIVDRVGAGDALLAVTSPCAAVGAPMEVIGLVGNAVGAQAVEIVGNRSVVPRQGLLSQIESLVNFDHWLTTR